MGRDGTGSRPLARLTPPLLLLALGLAGVVLYVIPRTIERRVEERLVATAARSGVVVRLRRVEFSWLGSLHLRDVTVERRGGPTAHARRLTLYWRPRFGPLRTWLRSVSHEGLAARLSREVEVALGDATWSVLALSRDELRVASRARSLETISVDLRRDAGGEKLELAFQRYPLGRLLGISRRGAPLLDAGTVDGHALLTRTRGGAISVEALALARAVRLATVPDEGEEALLGAPTDFDVSVEGTLDTSRRRLELACWRLSTSGVEVAGEASAEAADDDVWADVRLEMPRFELAAVLATSGIDLPIETLTGDLGSLSLSAHVNGHLKEPDSIVVEDDLAFRPPPNGVPALAYLRGPFTHTVVRPGDGETRIAVREGSPDYIALEEVPQLFVRALTIAEDAGFWGHPGIDVKEIPVAFATNWARGERARGASTITQQLVKNLFLSRQKRYSRKLQEVALTFLVESALDKRRILEIYLNIIEWGPHLYGLRPAARHYFCKEPAELTPKEIAFLVSLIPGPIKYQRSIAGGVLSPRFNALVVNLLAKLRSVDALTDEEYESARAETLRFGALPEEPSSSGVTPVPSMTPLPGPTPASEETPLPDVTPTPVGTHVPGEVR